MAREGTRSDWRNDVSAAWRAALSRALIFLVLALLNPFEIMQWSEQRSHDLWQRVHAHRYTMSAADETGKAAGRDRITVVYVDDESLEALGQARPIGGFDLLDMIEDIALAGGEAGKPRALFVDFLLTHSAPKGSTAEQLIAAMPAMRERCAARSREDAGLSPFQCILGGVAGLTNYEAWKADPRCRDSSLATIQCIRANGGLPVMFADPRPAGSRRKGEAREADEVSPALDALGTVALTVPVAVDPRYYPLVSPQSSRERENRFFRLYPAAALYAIHCMAESRACEGNPIGAGANGISAWSKRFDSDVNVTWGIGGESDFTRLIGKIRGGTLEQGCAPAAGGAADLVLLLARLLAAGVNLPDRQACRYTDAIPYQMLQTQIAQEDVARILGQRLVIFGGQFRDSNDLVGAPPFGQLPGVYYHAMALDNLIEQGADYLKPAVAIAPWLDATWADAVNILALFLIAFILAFANARLKRAEKSKSSSGNNIAWDLIKRIGTTLFFALAVFGILYIMTGQTRLIPENFNLVAVTLVCLWGLAQLIWTAIHPVRVLLLKHSPFIRFWSDVFDPPEPKARRKRA